MHEVKVGYDSENHNYVMLTSSPVAKDIVNKVLQEEVWAEHWKYDGKYFRFEPYPQHIFKVVPRFDALPSISLSFSKTAQAFTERLESKTRARMGICYATQVPDGFEVNERGLNFPLRTFQKVPIFIKEQDPKWYSKFILADEMGCGKTIEIISVITHFDLYPALLVVPKTLITNWHDECKKWIRKNVSIKVVKDGKDKSLRGHDIVIAPYSLIMHKKACYKAMMNRRFAFIGADEAHLLKNTKALRTRSFKGLASRCNHVILATGTPIKNYPVDLYSLISLIDKVHLIGSKDRFEQYFCDAKVNPNTGHYDNRGAENKRELNNIFRMLSIRRRKEQVVKELPPINSSVMRVDISNRAEYVRAEEEFIEWVRETTYAKLVEMGYNPREANNQALSKVAKAMAAEHLVKTNALRQLVAFGKMNFLKEWVNTAYEEETPQCIFLNYRQVQKEILAEFKEEQKKDVLHVFGSDKKNARDLHVARFKDPKGPPVIFLSIAIAGVGLTLIRSSRVVMFELPWTYADTAQCIARCHRIGQESKQVDVYYILGEGTIDEYMYNKVMSKKVNADIIIDNIEKNSEETAEVRDKAFFEIIKDIYSGKVQKHFYDAKE